MRVRTQSFIFSIHKKIMRLKGLNNEVEYVSKGASEQTMHAAHIHMWLITVLFRSHYNPQNSYQPQNKDYTQQSSSNNRSTLLY